MWGGEWWALVGKDDHLHNGETMHDYVSSVRHDVEHIIWKEKANEVDFQTIVMDIETGHGIEADA